MTTHTKRRLPLVIAAIVAVAACAFCTACDESKPSVGDNVPFVYELSEAGYTVAGVKDNGIKEIIVPEEYAGKAVTAIAEGAFAGCAAAQTVVIPSSVKSIGRGALRGLRTLKSITLPFSGQSENATNEKSLFGYIFGQADYAGSVETEQYFGEYAEDVETFYIPASISEITFNGARIPYGAFSNCSMASVFTVGSCVTEIGDRAFEGNNLAYVYCDSNAISSLMLGENACGGLLANIPAVCVNKSLNRLSGYVEGMDVKSDWSKSGVAYDMYANTKAYRFEAEKAELGGGLSSATSDFGANGVPTSGGASVGGFYPNGGTGECYMEFRINSSKAAKVKFIYCCGARSTHFFNSCYRLTLNGTVVVPENNVNLSLPAGVSFQWTQWTRFEIMELDLVAGENVFNMHFTPDGKDKADSFSNDMYVDYIEFETDAILTWAN